MLRLRLFHYPTVAVEKLAQRDIRNVACDLLATRGTIKAVYKISKIQGHSFRIKLDIPLVPVLWLCERRCVRREKDGFDHAFKVCARLGLQLVKKLHMTAKEIPQKLWSIRPHPEELLKNVIFLE